MVSLTSTTRIKWTKNDRRISMFRIFVTAARRYALVSGVLTAFFFTGVGRGAPDPACTVHVSPTESIQTKIDAAAPGATICVDAGVYRENLHIAKDGITLKGEGPGITVLERPAKPVQVCVPVNIEPIGYQNFDVNGICVADVNADGDILRVVKDVRVTGFTVRNFRGVGIIFAGTNRPRADHNVAANNSGYGITAFNSTHGLFEYNVSYGSGDAGFYVGNSPNADFTVRYNTAFANLWGILVRDASIGSVRDNMLRDSCSGLVFLNSGTTTGVHNWRASHNIVVHNDEFCPVGDLPFALTGVGILIGGGDHIVREIGCLRIGPVVK
jgi:hypothetical protein